MACEALLLQRRAGAGGGHATDPLADLKDEKERLLHRLLAEERGVFYTT